MRISLIAAVAQNRVIGREGNLPWKLSADLKHFKQTTHGHCMIMGRKTFESLLHPLPERTSLVVSRNHRTSDQPGVYWMTSLQQALNFSRDRNESEVFIIGGSELFALALPLAHRFYLSEVHAEVVGDVLFPKYDRSEWNLISQQDFPQDAKNQYSWSLKILERPQ